MALRGAIALLGVLSSFLVAAPSAEAGQLDECAQRVIRDWYSGGRVDGTYPLACYRAAIRALPNDVLQYSDAGRDISRALEYARRGRSDPGNGSSTPDASAPAQPSIPKNERSTSAAVEPPARPPADMSARLASGPDQPAPSSGLSLPVLALLGVAGVLLLSAVAGWLAARRR
ncbi:MAG TPA: hypothetical protein VHH57_07880 [Gaiella sp.]|jgi:hypothetical protein|nr:hypothetical protein [Gaiella sp.]